MTPNYLCPDSAMTLGSTNKSCSVVHSDPLLRDGVSRYIHPLGSTNKGIYIRLTHLGTYRLVLHIFLSLGSTNNQGYASLYPKCK